SRICDPHPLTQPSPPQTSRGRGPAFRDAESRSDDRTRTCRPSAPARGGDLHLHHRDDRHAGVRHRHSRAAAPDRPTDRRQHRQGRGLFQRLQNLFMLTQFVCSPIQGALSDRFGRRTVILISSFGLGIDFIVMALAPVLWLLLVGRVVSGICAASFSTANAYIADITPREKRAAAFGMLGGAFALGFIVGPALGGFLGHLWIRLPFWVAAGLSLLNFCYGLFVLPESHPKERRSTRIDWRQANPLGSLILLRRYPQVFALAAVFFLLALAQFALNSTYVLYTDYRYGWGPQIVGYSLGVVGLCTGLVQAVPVRRWMPWLGERRMMLTGVALLIVGYMVLALRRTPGCSWPAFPSCV